MSSYLIYYIRQVDNTSWQILRSNTNSRGPLFYDADWIDVGTGPVRITLPRGAQIKFESQGCHVDFDYATMSGVDHRYYSNIYPHNEGFIGWGNAQSSYFTDRGDFHGDIFLRASEDGEVRYDIYQDEPLRNMNSYSKTYPADHMTLTFTSGRGHGMIPGQSGQQVVIDEGIGYISTIPRDVIVPDIHTLIIFSGATESNTKLPFIIPDDPANRKLQNDQMKIYRLNTSPVSLPDTQNEDTVTFQHSLYNRDTKTYTIIGSPLNFQITTTDGVDTVPPVFTSGTTATAIDENSGAGQAIYTATIDDTADADSQDSFFNKNIYFRLGEGADNDKFSLRRLIPLPTTVRRIGTDAAGDYTAEVTLKENPDYNTKSQYNFSIRAWDETGSYVSNFTEHSITLNINEVDSDAPFINSGAIGTALDENSEANQDKTNQTVYTTTVTDISPVTFGIVDGFGFSIDSNTGIVKTNSVFFGDHAVDPVRTFTVVATDSFGNSSQQTVEVEINNLIPALAPITTENPNYEFLLEQLVHTPEGTLKEDRKARCYRFSQTLVVEEKQLFDFAYWGSMDFTPSASFLAENPNSNNDPYVGDYLGFPPGVLVDQNPIPPDSIEPPVVQPDPEPEQPPDLSPEPETESEAGTIFIETSDPPPGPDPTLQFTDGAVLVSSEGKILFDSNGIPVKIAEMNFTVNDINIILDRM